ncbi:beta-lactamase [Hirsutella rhossiliensis]|uniref:Beta-lactamase domain-containing protein n=1 Tax=Hirsutella rhossiliensis TaxID=111463 RepID=A0A9P8N2X9_9HYPO|nr:beta-lactamase domain-containing protein [Hirsutella rhossiliensis]KAH0965910.1 beta-lactamase domain-containing protein [Hirsutella rhossiliensis]
MRIGGTPGLSLGLMHQGNQETILPVCSLTKAVTSAAVGILVDEKKAAWDTLVKDALPSLDIKDETLQNQMTIADLLCHRSGMSWGDNLIIGTDNNILISEKGSMTYLNSQTRLLPFRGQFAYNNLAYELAGKVIEALSKESYFDFVQSRILDPLGMTRTYLKTPPPDLDNVGKCYNAPDDGTSAPITCVKAGDDWVGTPHVGMRTCVSDLMKLYKAFMKGFNDQFSTGNTSTEGLPLKQVTQLMSAKMFMDQPSRTRRPMVSAGVAFNFPGEWAKLGITPRLVIFHQGSMPGVLSLNMLLPDTESAIVISSNALALNDVPDWVGQMVLEEFLEVPASEHNDYLAAAKTSAKMSLQWYPNLIKELQQAQKNGTCPRELDTYAGTYWDSLHIFKIVVTVEDNHLYWALPGLESEKFRLTHYEDDIFTWLQPPWSGPLLQHNQGEWVVLHIGKCTQKNPGSWLGSNARRDVYKGTDDEGQRFPMRQLSSGGLWKGLPTELRLCFDVDWAVEAIAREHPPGRRVGAL